MIKDAYEVDVLINGRPAKEYSHKERIYIEGRKDTEFSLRFRNNTPNRKLFIPTIDGLSVMDGQEASFDSSGYIVGPYSSTTIDGWRTSDKEVAKFFFSSPEKSYAKRKGKSSNTGVIGCAVFAEKPKATVVYDMRDYWPDMFPNEKTITWSGTGTGPAIYSTSSIPTSGELGMRIEASSLSMDSNGKVEAAYLNSDEGVMRSMSNQKLGTGWGDQKRSEVTSVEFLREDQPREVFEIVYNTKAELKKLGIEFKEPVYVELEIVYNTKAELKKLGIEFKEPVYVALQAFPNEKRYCEPPQD